MEKTLFLSLIFSSPIIFGFFMDHILKRTLYKSRYKDYIFDFFWGSSLLITIFGLLNYTIFIGNKISILLSTIVLLFLGGNILNNFLLKKIDNNDIKRLFLYKNIKQFILIFLYILWIRFFIGGNLSFFSNITLGSLLIEVVKFIPIFVYIFGTIDYNTDRVKGIYIIFSYFSLIFLFFTNILIIEKIFKYYVPNRPIFSQIFLGFFLLIFLTKDSILNKIGYFSKDDIYKIKILGFLIIGIILCIII